MSSTLDVVRNTIREVRLERGLSQAQLGEAMGVSRQTIISIETGRYLPSLPLAIHLARFFDTAVEELFHDD
jgi:putative transcriptional regulator